MSYVIYNKETTMILKARGKSWGMWVESYKSEAAAKAALTRLDKAGKLDKDTVKEDYAIASSREFYENIEKKVERKNLMSGKPYMEGVNTPAYLSPACESYWSM